MAGMGPPPKPAGQKRNNGRAPMANTLKLPAGGREGPTPDWPLARATKAELGVWAVLWKTPQSVAWERLGYERVVARYVRVLIKAETKLLGMHLSDARQLEDRLGLTPMAMLRLRWEIAPDEIAEARDDRTPRVRLVEAVDPTAGAGG